MSKSVVACLEDLFFRSKIDATARNLNVPVRFTNVAGLAQACSEPGVAAALVELSVDAVDMIRKIREGREKDLPIVGFLSHVDRELAAKAQAAGATQVMPRSQFAETLPDLLMDLVAPGTHREVQEEPELPDE
jgi:DNA-binding NarL/FixJ family response regulator